MVWQDPMMLVVLSFFLAFFLVLCYQLMSMASLTVAPLLNKYATDFEFWYIGLLPFGVVGSSAQWGPWGDVRMAAKGTICNRSYPLPLLLFLFSLLLCPLIVTMY